jgi:hypothetical protein
MIFMRGLLAVTPNRKDLAERFGALFSVRRRLLHYTRLHVEAVLPKE